MEEQLHRVSLLSLREMAERKIAVLLWTEPRTLISFWNSHFKSSSVFYGHPKEWREIVESNFSDKISKLRLPGSLAKKMIQIIKPIGLQILGWKLYQEANLSAGKEFFDVSILEKLQWTAAGSVDYRKTAEELVRSDVFAIVKRYELACLYCLDQYVPELWKELPQDNKRHFYKEASNITIQFLAYCWPYILKGEEYKMLLGVTNSNAFNQEAFRCLSSLGNKAAAQYFFQKLSPEEREASLMRAANAALGRRNRNTHFNTSAFENNNISNVIFYLLSEMTPVQQAQIISERPADVLGCLFDWPWQDAFLDFFDVFWTWIQCEDMERRARNYDSLLDVLVKSIQNSDYYLPKLFQNFFMSSPSDFKKHFVDRECCSSTVSLNLLTMEDTETWNVVLNSLDAGSRLGLASSKRILTYFYHVISSGRGNDVESCLRRIGLSKEDKVSLKKDFMELVIRRDGGTIELRTLKWKRFFKFLDETEAKAQPKRNSDPTLPEAKKLCCEK